MVLIWLIKVVLYNFFVFLLYVKDEWEYWFNLLSKKNRDVILNRAKDYYKNKKERLRRQARDKYRNLSEEEKIKKDNMGKIDITWKKETKTKRISKKLWKIIVRKKNLNIIPDRITF